MDPGVRPLLHAEVVQGQVRVGEVDVVGAGAEDGRQDGHHRDYPDEQDDGANSCNLKNMYRVTIQLVSNLLLTSKQKLHFSIRSIN